MQNRNAIVISIAILAACSLLSLFLNACVNNDAAAYYIPMAEAFGSGQYEFAFNPMIPPLVPFLTGVILYLIPISGFTAMKIVASVFILLGLIPVYRLSRRLLTAEQAGWSCLLYAVCAQVIRFGITPQLTAAKLFLVIWLFEGCVSVYERRSIKTVTFMSLAFALLALCRTEGIFYAPLCVAAVFIPVVINQNSRRHALVQSTLALGLSILICLALWSPWLVYEYQSTGHAVLDSRQIMILNKLTPGEDTQYAESQITPLEFERQKAIYAQSMGEKLTETLDGLYLPYLALTCLAFVQRFRKKQWGYLESWTLGAVLLHVAMIWGASTIGGGPVLKRYIFPAALLFMPYSAVGWVIIKNDFVNKIKNPRFKLFVMIAVLAIVFVSVGDGLKQVIDTVRGKYEVEMKMGLWIREHVDELDGRVLPLNAPIDTINGQWTGRSLIIAAAFPQTACWAQAQHIKIDRRQEKTMEELVDICKTFGVDILKVDEAIRRSTANFDPVHPYLRPLKSPWSGSAIELYQCGP